MFGHWDEDEVVPCFDCQICAFGDGNCLTAMGENNFEPASKEQIITRLKDNRFPDYRKSMIDTLKQVYNVNWEGV